MRRLVLADVHANLHALEAVLEAAERIGYDGVVCAGDVVGYGAFPNECVARVAALDPLAVAGNHDLIVLGELSDARCIPLARASLDWTRAALSDDARTWLAALPRRARAGGIAVAHGSLDDPEEYVARPEQAAAELQRLESVEPDARWLVLGHTHRPRLLRGALRALLNPGAVGQSRELRARARFALLDEERDEATLHAVPYDVAAARRALSAAGLAPGSLHLRPGPRGAARRILRKAGLR